MTAIAESWCDVCAGTGTLLTGARCDLCRGTGKATEALIQLRVLLVEARTEIARLRNLESLVREWQEARKPTTLAAPGEFLAETFQAAVRRMSAADDALAAYLLDGPDDETEQCETCQQPITGQVVWSWDDVPLCEACAEVETPAAGKRAQTPNEAEMLRALSGALTGGNASTWEQVLHAAERLRDESTLLNEWIPGDPVGMNEQPRHHPSLRDELAEIIRWRFRTADGEIMDGVKMLKRAQEIASEIAPYIEEATGEPMRPCRCVITHTTRKAKR